MNPRVINLLKTVIILGGLCVAALVTADVGTPPTWRLETRHQEPNPRDYLVQIGVRVVQRSDSCLYLYTVANRSNDTLTSIQIGYDSSTEQCELTGAPPHAPPDTAYSPAGWECSPVQMKHNRKTFAVGWKVSRGLEETGGIPPNASMSGFTVVLPKHDTLYERCHFRTPFKSLPSMSAVGRLMPESELDIPITATGRKVTDERGTGPYGPSARAETGAISGRVVDQGGAVVPYVAVQLKGTMLGAMTNLDGYFHIPKVPVGTYTVLVRSVRFTTSERAGVQVSTGQTATLEFRLTGAPVRLPAGSEITRTPRARAIGIDRAATFREDSLALLGAWQWVHSGGSWGTNEIPPPSGWSRVLYFQRDGSYSFWEEDSAGKYRICGGKFALHAPERSAARPQSWIELPGWWEGLGEREWVQLLGSDTLTLYPGGGGEIVSDANTHTFIRHRDRSVPTEAADTPRARWRPARLIQYVPISYAVYLPPALTKARESVGRIYEWGDFAYSLGSYRYTNYQIPSAVIGDFDGDSLADVAIHGWDGKTEDKVACLLSGHASPRAVTLLVEPVTFDREHHCQPPLYLELFPAGQSFTDSLGNRVALQTDAIRVIPMKGQTVIYYYKNGTFHRGSPTYPPPLKGNR